MEHLEWTVGIDVAAESFVAAVWKVSERRIVDRASFANTPDGFAELFSWLLQQQVRSEESLICLEATGVYSEALSYRLVGEGWSVAVEAPQKVHRVFRRTQKNDLLDAMQIAEYAWRYSDQLTRWQPSSRAVEELRVLLSTREQLVGYRTAQQNSLKSLQRKVVISRVAQQVQEQTIAHLQQQIQQIDDAIAAIVEEDRQIGDHARRLRKVPGVGLLLIANLAVLTQGFVLRVESRHLCSLLGIAPREHSSGTSIRRRPRSSGHGPHRIRKLLYLAAMSRRRNDNGARVYYQRKIAEGKPPRVVLNNLANKLIALLCALITSEAEYDPRLQAVHLAEA
ncbi:MAG: IS110 family transposase [Ignavibacteriae bacterium]|nr:IS110 family transposase [Ignavibacteriota bacterium]MCB9216004.1 IS110 family transposase [Ignavibacteria bacterium]